MSPTESGLRMVPLMGGTLFTSILSGQIASRTGRYKIFPIIGTTMVTLALFLISRMTAETTNLNIAMLMLLLGFGLGFVMQMLIIAVQNAVEYHDLGVATSNAILFRSIGGSLGTALLGAILATRLLETKSLIASLDTVFLVADIHVLGRKGKADPNKLGGSRAELLEKSLIAAASAANVYTLTVEGCDIYNRLVAARREHLAELWPEWSPKKREEVATILRNLARELIPETNPSLSV